MSKYSGRPWKYENEWDTICNILSSSNCHRIAAIKFVSLTLTILHFIMCSFSCMGGDCKYICHYHMIHWFPAYFIIYSFLVFSGSQRALNIFGKVFLHCFSQVTHHWYCNAWTEAAHSLAAGFFQVCSS